MAPYWAQGGSLVSGLSVRFFGDFGFLAALDPS